MSELTPAARNDFEIMEVPYREIAQTRKKAPLIIVEQKPDSFESKISVTGYAAAAATAGTAAYGSYNAAKNIIPKALKWVENERNSYLGELGHAAKNLPNTLKVNSKYFGAIAAAITTALLVFKDSDKDGKLDILEAAQKFINPQ